MSVPNWARSCANPVFPYTSPQLPAYPGTASGADLQNPLMTLQDWKTSCLSSGQIGNCAFLNYATNPGATGPSVDCGDIKLPPGSLLPSVGHASVVDGAAVKTVCFDNFKAKGQDRLCIFQNFQDGNVNVEQMDPTTRPRNLQGLIDGYAQEVAADVLQKQRFCLHHSDQASVGWTHLHVFDQSIPAGSWPDGLSTANAYCAVWQGDPKTTAKALDDAVAALWKNNAACLKDQLASYDRRCDASATGLKCCSR
jgi:hypothetical protein